MAIYHLETKVVSRGTGRSAVAAAAYMSCSQILNDYDGVQHDFTRKKGLVWQQIFLPEYAPVEWQERAVLWNAVEENEKTKDSRLAREFVVALPVELNKKPWKSLLSDFINEQFVADGMCADVAIHDPHPPGHNPHAHIMLTVRPLDENGKWQYKTEKEYLCIKDGEERGFTKLCTPAASEWEGPSTRFAARLRGKRRAGFRRLRLQGQGAAAKGESNARSRAALSGCFADFAKTQKKPGKIPVLKRSKDARRARESRSPFAVQSHPAAGCLPGLSSRKNRLAYGGNGTISATGNPIFQSENRSAAVSALENPQSFSENRRGQRRESRFPCPSDCQRGFFDKQGAGKTPGSLRHGASSALSSSAIWRS